MEIQFQIWVATLDLQMTLVQSFWKMATKVRRAYNMREAEIFFLAILFMFLLS